MCNLSCKFAIEIKVVKTNVTLPICVRHHIDICPNVSITSIKTNTSKFFNTLGLPLLCMMTENRFNRHKIGNQK